LLAEIAQGEYSVSMECLFNKFDYILTAPDGTTRIVARNDKTAFLTKHLRCYAGSGYYGDSKVGRVLRNIVFSGKGLVKNPANADSVILSPAAPPLDQAVAAYLDGRNQRPTLEPIARPTTAVARDILNYFAR